LLRQYIKSRTGRSVPPDVTQNDASGRLRLCREQSNPLKLKKS
jgi:hypothetical protein